MDQFPSENEFSQMLIREIKEINDLVWSDRLMI